MSESVHALGSPQSRHVSMRVPTSPSARAKRQIATLMEEVEVLKQDKATKKRKMTFYVSQGRAIRRMVDLYAPIEDLIAENDRRCEESDKDATPEQDRLQRGYIELAKALSWLHDKLAGLDHEESDDMLKKLKRGADSARGDDMGTLKELVASWVNIECCPTPLIRTDDKHHRGFAGIRDRTTAFIVSENSWPSFMYENYEADTKNLERGLFKSKLLVMAIFTSPSSAHEVDGEGDGADIIENNWRARNDPIKLKYEESDSSRNSICSLPDSICTFEPHVLAHSRWRFRLPYFLEQCSGLLRGCPSPAARARVNKLLEWWTRKVFGRNHRQDLTADIVSHMSVSTLATQRQQMEDAELDSD
ncbi:uncharacterized protein F5891DRAFT_980403 [Suillus fuscotomentosus]|uniref:Uncharacterized protein n=1 Tax=Suillus fuscotomentosus TaxID=1912939 RepID=A0AAD4E6G1_9AGAM|nr:uncharacterized protein F5891DRAFT_980403 [Suillus fuscotomentosus]KAG1900470.1 hypothetical protein F5891DRAFT_980403 [Suillus fuscotomentosus]